MPPRAFFALFLTLFLSVRAAAADVPSHFFLELDIAIERGGHPGLLFDYGAGFWGDHGILGTVPPGTTPSTVRLQMPTRPIRALRFDPATDDSPIDLTGLRLANDRGEVLLRIDPKTLRPWHQIAAIEPIPGGVRIRSTPKADDPMLHLNLEPLQQRIHAAMQRPPAGPGSVTALAVLLAASSPPARASAPSPPPPSRSTPPCPTTAAISTGAAKRRCMPSCCSLSARSPPPRRRLRGGICRLRTAPPSPW